MLTHLLCLNNHVILAFELERVGTLIQHTLPYVNKDTNINKHYACKKLQTIIANHIAKIRYACITY